MKHLRFILLAGAFLAVTAATAQELPRRVFAAGGGQGGSLSWTIGQAGLAGTMSSASVELNIGFQQFDNLLVSTDEFLSTVNLTVYPNPFQDEFYLDLQTADPVNISVRLYDNYGRLLLDQDFGQNTSGIRQSIQTRHLTPGMYSLLVTTVDKNNKTAKQLFKLIKH